MPTDPIGMRVVADALSHAVIYDQPESVDFLFDLIRPHDGMTNDLWRLAHDVSKAGEAVDNFLREALQTGHYKMAAALMSHGADINAYFDHHDNGALVFHTVRCFEWC